MLFWNAFREFLTRVRQELPESIPEQHQDEEAQELHLDEKKLLALIESANISEAFFLARRLVASGESWAETYLEQCRSLM